LVENRRL